jgi:hypothetical protein
MRVRLHPSLRPLVAAVAISAVMASAVIGPVLAISPTPVLGGTPWGQDQAVGYRWRTGQVPPSWLQPAINAAAADSNGSRASRAATLAYNAAAPSLISYDAPTRCASNALACADRGGAPSSFTVAYQRNGYVFDWGTLRWCQAYATLPTGCFDAEAIGLHELGHVIDLGHYLDSVSGAAYLDTVMQPVSRQYPATGWNLHQYGRCDVALLQRLYDMQTWSAPYSTCGSVATVATLAVGAAGAGGSRTFTATLKVAPDATIGKLADNPVTGRVVVLQRRASGTTTWSTVATMATGPSSGTYVSTVAVTAKADWRAVFATPAAEGLTGSTSAIVTVSATACVGQCPSNAQLAAGVR